MEVLRYNTKIDYLELPRGFTAAFTVGLTFIG